ncbi:conserved repeat domain-containing protein/fimbrial isopeptide formation D2 domain-containing protein [Caloramator quimbayensis]|uniref:Conserved repeat domain-containing protein/fimbrial isopeptide formation D2 domain-containing protein n=1 Tax=Caloramator quimbayensis TaxID=1147123 RepID=A0A1T4WRC6_9CLOT|nr:isopeptide-forming domain-containing fimbrial protein [Caloramator quimbayensis]SKA79425.1 conserved repeat domain-containing protein/fimbrial isopeptide formation D2 domain-containing protein [Caloramator quimbayensis]
MPIIPADFLISQSPSPLKIVLGKSSSLSLSFSNISTLDRAYNLTANLIIPDGFSFVSSSIAPTQITNNLDGTITLNWINIKDLAPNEINYSITVEIKSDEYFRNTLLPVPFDIPVPNITSTATVDTLPRGDEDSGNIKISKTSISSIVPLRYNLIKKGPSKMPKGAGLIPSPSSRWPFTYTLILDNNTREASNITLIDNLPNGVRYLGNLTASGTDALSFLSPSIIVPSPPAPCSNYTIIDWGSKTLSAGSITTINFDCAIWDKYTQNCIENSGQKIPHKTPLINTAILDGLSGPVTSNLTTLAMDITIDKSVSSNITDVGTYNNFTLDYKVNQYNNTNSVVIEDTLPDGMQYISGSGSIPPSSVTVNPNGTTTIIWNLGNLAAGSTGSITFSSITLSNYINTNPVAANDSLTNKVNIDGLNSSSLKETPDNSSVTLTIKKPFIEKKVLAYYYNDGTLKPFNIASPLDLVEFYIKYDAQAIQSTQLNVEVDEYAPLNMGPLIPLSITYGGNLSGLFTPYTVSPNGIRWSLGNIPGGKYWTATFKVPVKSDTFMGVRNNLSKLAARNSESLSYSDRDQVEVKFGMPNIKFSKTVNGPNINAIQAGEVYTYTIKIENPQNGENITTDAFMMTLNDVIPNGLIYNGSYTVTGTGIYDAPTFIGQNVSMLIKKLGPNDSLTLTYDVLVTSSVVSGQLYINSAYLTSPYSQYDKSYQYPLGPFTASTALKTKRLSIKKTIAPPFVRIGDIATYILEVKIPKGTVAYNIKVTDTYKTPQQVYVGNATLNGAPISPTVTPPNVVFPTIPYIDATLNEVTLLYSFDIRVIDASHIPPYSENQINSAKVEWDIDSIGTHAIPEITSENLIVKTPNLTALKEQRNYTLNNSFRTVNLSFSIGDIIEYRITVTNNGLVPAYDSVITDALNPLFSFVIGSFSATLGTPSIAMNNITWSIPTLNQGQSATLTFRVLTLPGFAANSQTPNTASFIYNTNTNGYGKTYSGNSNTVNIVSPNLTLKKTSSLLLAEIGDDLEYTLTITIPYGTYAYSLRVRDTLPSGQIYLGPATRQEDGGSIVTVVPTISGQTITFPINPDLFAYPDTKTLIYKFKARVTSGNHNPPFTQTQQNQSRIDWAIEPGGGYVRNRTSNLNITVRAPNIIIKKEQKNYTKAGDYTQNPISANPEDIIYFKITIDSNGASPAYNIILDDILSDKFIYQSLISISHGSFNYTSGPPKKITWTIPVLNNGTTATLEFSVKIISPIAASSSITNKADSTYDSNDVNPVTYNASSNTTVINIPPLTIQKNADITQAKIGDEITYTITIPIPDGIIAYNLKITDVFPIKQQFVSFNHAPYTLIGNMLTYTETTNPVIGPALLTYTLKTKIIDGKTSYPYFETQTNNVSAVWNLSLTGPSSPVIYTSKDITVKSPHLIVEKLQRNATKGGDFTKDALLDIASGDEIQYKINITNNGASTAINVVTTDDLSSFLTFDSVIGTPVGTVNHPTTPAPDGTVTWSGFDLLVNETQILIFSCIINSSPTPGQAVQNKSETYYDTNTINPVTLGPEYSNIVQLNYAYPQITKTADKTSALVGDIIEYTINVTVPKGVKIYDVEINDTLLSQQSYIPYSLTKNDVPLGAITLDIPVETEIDATSDTVIIEYKFKASVDSIISPPQEAQTNNVTLNWKYTPLGPSGPEESSSVVVYVSNANINLTKSQKNYTKNPLSPFVTSDINADFLDIIYYELKIQNPNSYDLSNVIVSDILDSIYDFIEVIYIDTGTINFSLDTITWNVGILPSDTEYKAIIALKINKIGLSGYRIANIFYAEFSIKDADPIVVYGPLYSNIVYVVLSDILITKYASSNTVKVGDVFTYYIEIKVPLGTKAKDIIIKDTLPLKQVYVGPAQYDSTIIEPHLLDNEIIFNIPEIDASYEEKTVVLSFNVRVLEGNNSPPFTETQTNNVTATNIIDDKGTVGPLKTASLNVEVTRPYVFIPKSQRNITKGTGYTEDMISVNADDIIEFRLVAHNLGSSTAYNVIVEDIISSYFEYTGIYDAQYGTVSYDSSTQKIKWIIDEIPINTAFILTFQVKVVGGIPAGNSTNDSALFEYSTNNTTPITFINNKTNIVVQLFPEIKAVKTSNIYYTSLNGIIRYTVTFTLPKGTSIYNGQFTDFLPIGQTYLGNATLMGMPIEPVEVDAQKVVFPVVPYYYAEFEDENFNYEFDVKITSAIIDPITQLDAQYNYASGEWYFTPYEKSLGICSCTYIYVTDSNISLVKQQKKADSPQDFTTNNITGSLQEFVEYKLIVKNSGPNKIYSVNVKDILSPDLKFIETIYAEGILIHTGEDKDGTILINIDSIDVSSEKTFIFKMQILKRASGFIDNLSSLSFKLSNQSPYVFEGIISNTVRIDNKASGKRGVSIKKIIELKEKE